jgi:DNA-binding transcriptional regulator GbsR (MarR family)
MIKYPAIEQFRNAIRDVAHKFPNEKPIVEFHGTVKLHGTNASVGMVYGYNHAIT